MPKIHSIHIHFIRKTSCAAHFGGIATLGIIPNINEFSYFQIHRVCFVARQIIHAINNTMRTRQRREYEKGKHQIKEQYEMP